VWCGNAKVDQLREQARCPVGEEASSTATWRRSGCVARKLSGRAMGACAGVVRVDAEPEILQERRGALEEVH